MKAGKSILFSIIGVILLLVLISSPVLAQTPETSLYRLNINRDFGYGAGADIKGLFTLRVVGPEDLANISYFIDGKLMAAVTDSPYTYQFNTSQYSFGTHDLRAEVTNKKGIVFSTPARHLNFVSPEEQAAGMKDVIMPILLVIVVVFVIAGLVQFTVMRKRNPNGIAPGSQRNYGFAGGSICRNCGRPTPRHIWGINIGIGKLDRCENCGKWSVMQAAPYEILRAAELAEKTSVSDTQSFIEKSDEEKLRELIDKSKYE